MRLNVMVGLLLAVAIGIAGCGGGGSDTPSIPAAPASDFTGTWSGSYSGTTFRYIVSQSGNNLDITRTTPIATGITYSGTGSGDTAVINTYGNGTYMGYTTWSKTSGTTISVYLNSCIPITGFSCGASNGITLNLTKQ
ncbi:MAG: hypothetical protein ACOYL3_07300 [Desulfuromonadaceae bacterium]